MSVVMDTHAAIWYFDPLKTIISHGIAEDHISMISAQLNFGLVRG